MLKARFGVVTTTGSVCEHGSDGPAFAVRRQVGSRRRAPPWPDARARAPTAATPSRCPPGPLSLSLSLSLLPRRHTRGLERSCLSSRPHRCGRPQHRPALPAESDPNHDYTPDQLSLSPRPVVPPTWPPPPPAPRHHTHMASLAGGAIAVGGGGLAGERPAGLPDDEGAATTSTREHQPIHFFYVHLHDQIRAELDELAKLVMSLEASPQDVGGASEDDEGDHAGEDGPGAAAPASAARDEADARDRRMTRRLEALKRRYAFLEQVYKYHSSVEDEVRLTPGREGGATPTPTPAPAPTPTRARAERAERAERAPDTRPPPSLLAHTTPPPPPSHRPDPTTPPRERRRSSTRPSTPAASATASPAPTPSSTPTRRRCSAAWRRACRPRCSPRRAPRAAPPCAPCPARSRPCTRPCAST